MRKTLNVIGLNRNFFVSVILFTAVVVFGPATANAEPGQKRASPAEQSDDARNPYETPGDTPRKDFSSDKKLTGSIQSIKDIDTFGIHIPARDGIQTVIMHGIDGLESSQPRWETFIQYLRKMFDNKEAMIYPIGEQSGSSLTALVYVDGACINSFLLYAGYAWLKEDCEHKRVQYWQKLQKMAENAARGLWSRQDPIPPWEWRDRMDGLFKSILM